MSRVIPPEVIVIGSSSPKHRDVVIIGDDGEDKPPPHNANTSANDQQDPKINAGIFRRFSDIFNEFRAKWLNYETAAAVSIPSQEESLGAIPRSITNPMVVREKKGPRKKKLRQEIKPRKPRNKNESLKEIEIVVDERIEVDANGFADGLVVTRERLHFDPFQVMLWRDKEGNPGQWIVCVYKCDDHFVIHHEQVLEEFVQISASYPKRSLILLNWRTFQSQYDKKMQRGFRAALKEQRRFSGSGFINLESFRRKLFIDCMARQVKLIEMDLNGPYGRSLERWIGEASKAIAWAPYCKHYGGLEAKKRGVGKDPEDVYRKMLRCVPRISNEIIDAIICRYPKLMQLITALKNNGPEVLANIPINEQRTIGPSMGEKLHFLFTSQSLRARKVK